MSNETDYRPSTTELNENRGSSKGSFSMKTYFGIGVVGILVIFLLQNLEVSTIDFLLWSFTLPKIFMYLTMMVIGFITGVVFIKKK